MNSQYNLTLFRIVRVLLAIILVIVPFFPVATKAQQTTPTPIQLLPNQNAEQTETSSIQNRNSVELGDPMLLDIDLSAQKARVIETRIEEYLAQMSIADKVGQLFVITFEGSNVDAGSDIAKLIHNYRIGGVVISARNHNFTNEKTANTPTDVAILTNQLQALAYGLILSKEDALHSVSLDTEDATERSLIDLPSLVEQAEALQLAMSTTNENSTNPKNADQNNNAIDSTNAVETELITNTLSITSTVSITAPSLITALEPISPLLQPLNLPMLIGVEQAGDSFPKTSLRQGFTKLPTQLAIGATWNPELSRDIGKIVGRELAAVGINMLLGPNLDVIDQPRADVIGRLSIYSFGGDPYWVSQMGQKYISGIHEGSEGRVLSIVRHFPGQGDSDRLPEDAVATIQSSEQELKQVDLRPFADAMRQNSLIIDSNGDIASADGLMSSHMRFSSLQGPITERATPLSLAPRLSILLEDEQFLTWRERGLVMSNELGAPAIRRYYDPTLTDFPQNQIAHDAFNADHDLLYLSRYALNDDWNSERQNIVETIKFFQDSYLSDANFALQVDESVRRILRYKIELYGPDILTMDELLEQATANLTASSAITNSLQTSTTTDNASAETTENNIGENEALSIQTDLFNIASAVISETYHVTLTEVVPLSNVLVHESALDAFSAEQLGIANTTMQQVARESLTILYPDLTEQSEPFAPGPGKDDHLLIFTDSRFLRECNECSLEVTVGPDTLANVMQSLYGVDKTGQITEGQTTSLTFGELAEMLPIVPSDSALDSENQTIIDSSVAIALTGTTTITEALTPSEIEVFESEGEGDNSRSAQSSDNIEGSTSPETTTPTPVPTLVPTVAPTVTPTPIPTQLPETIARLDALLDKATWIIFVMLDVNEANGQNSNVVKRFLKQRGDQLRNKRIIVLGLNAPTFLDATEVSRLHAYLGVYSKTRPFLDNAVRALFNAYTPFGAAPVNVAGTRFNNLTERLLPDPARTLDLKIIVDREIAVPLLSDLGVEEGPPKIVGSSIRAQVGPILDHNGHQVPDGTSVEFILSYGDEDAQVTESIPTRNGVAYYDLDPERSGLVEIAAQSGSGEEIAASESLAIEIEGSGTQVAEVAPTPTGAVVVSGTEQATTTNPISSPIPPSLTGDPQSGQLMARVDLYTLLMAVLTIAVTLSLLLILQVRIMPRDDLVRHMLWAMIVGLFAYILYGVGVLPGVDFLQSRARPWGTVPVVFIAMLLPLLWLQLRTD
ncbi:hypothetical protein KFU94_02150 [Chloroflexi bacterium TSY]|nr:hypothetical protein [Chloroflexi bacterium TSY]